jgi:hypothetical protein
MNAQIELVVITDGRTEYFDAMLASLRESLPWLADSRAICVDDSGSPVYAEWLDRKVPRTWSVIHHPERRGLAAAVQSGWRATTADYVFHLEEDFLLSDRVSLMGMMHLLRDVPCLTQVTCKRQPWNESEIAAGGIMEQDRGNYIEKRSLFHTWTEHRDLFSLNPSLIPRRIIRMGWPASNEAGMTERVNAASWSRQAYWGGKMDPPIVTHIGRRRSPGWTL